MNSKKLQTYVVLGLAIGAVVVARRVATVEGAALGLTPLEVTALIGAAGLALSPYVVRKIA